MGLEHFPDFHLSLGRTTGVGYQDGFPIRIGPILNSADNIDRLAKLLGDDEPVVQEVAASALKRVGKHAARALPALQCARSPEPPTPLMQQVINDIKAQTGAEDGIQWVPSAHHAEAAAWNSLSFCSSTGYCVNVAESDQHRIARLEIKYNGQDVPLSAGALDAIEHPFLNDIHLISVGNTQRLDIPFKVTDASGAATNKVYSLTLDQGRVVTSSTRAD